MNLEAGMDEAHSFTKEKVSRATLRPSFCSKINIFDVYRRLVCL